MNLSELPITFDYDRYNLTFPQKEETPVYSSEEEARTARPRAFKEVETRWGRAGYISQRFPLKDGRVLHMRGIDWDVPEPGGKCVALWVTFAPAEAQAV